MLRQTADAHKAENVNYDTQNSLDSVILFRALALWSTYYSYFVRLEYILFMLCQAKTVD